SQLGIVLTAPKGEQLMRQLSKSAWLGLGVAAAIVVLGLTFAGTWARDKKAAARDDKPAKEADNAKNDKEVPNSFAPVVSKERFATVMARMKAAKDDLMKRQRALLEERYDLSDKPSKKAKMSGGKPIQVGIRVKLPEDVTWEQLAEMSPHEICKKDLFPKGFLPLPHPNHPEGGMLFPKFHIDEIKKQENRDLTRF